jgi:hypothetical protein
VENHLYQLFKNKNISESTIYQAIKDCENDLPCVVKPKIAKPRVADNKKGRNVLQSIKNRVRASSQLVANKNNITHSTVVRSLKKNDVIHKKRVKIPKYMPTQLEKIPRSCRFLLRKHFCDQTLIVKDN